MSGKKIPYIQFKNYQVYQETTLIGLLMYYGEITVSVRGKKTEKEILTFLHIGEVHIEGEDGIDCNDVVTNKCEELKTYEIKSGLKEKTAQRRFHKNKIIETLHLLMDLLSELGLTFNTYTTNGKNGAIRAETIRSIQLANGRNIDSHEIKELGKQIYSEVIQRLKKVDSVLFVQNDKSITSIFESVLFKHNTISNLLPEDH